MQVVQSAYIELTSQCNLDCMHCYNANERNLSSSSIEYNVLLKTLDYFIGNGLTRVALSGGEPLMYEHIEELLDYIQKNNLEMTLITNGTLITDHIIRKIQKIEKSSIIISMESSDKSIHNKIRNNSFDEIAKNFRIFQDNGYKNVIIKMVITQYNIMTITDFYEWVLDNGFIPEFGSLQLIGSAVENKETLAITKDQLISAVDTINKLHSKYHYPKKQEYTSMSCPLSDREAPLGIMIKFNGDINPCQALYDCRFKIGSIYNEGLFNENKIEKIRQLADKRFISDYGCSRCISKTVCHKGCLANWFNPETLEFAFDDLCQLRISQCIRDIKDGLHK